MKGVVVTPEKVIESTRVEGLRVALYLDEDKSPLSDEGDWLPPVIRLLPADVEVDAGEQYVDDFTPAQFRKVAANRGARDTRSLPQIQEDLRTKLGIEYAHRFFSGHDTWVVGTAAWLATLTPGLSDAEIMAELMRCGEYVTDYDQGHIYGWRIEREVVYTSDPDRLGGVQQVTEWEEQDSCWGYVGMAWAELNAREQLADEELREPIELPQGRPSVHQDRAAMLWNAVVEPALTTPEPFFHVGTTEDAGASGWAINLRLGWGEDITNEYRLDEHTTWAALVAVASGAMRVEPELALECRALVMGWAEKPALSKAAAEAVVQVALIGEAPYPAIH